ncbi:MAG: cytochrome P450 [Myxococcota bacterium]
MTDLSSYAADFDPLDTVKAIPYEGYALLRKEKPIVRTESGVWFLSRQADIIAAAKAVDTFRASFREPGTVIPPEEMLISEIPEPRHGRMRKIVNSAIAAHRLARVEGVARELTESLVDEAFGRDEVDLVKDIVVPIPASVIAHLLGAPPEDYQKWADWSDEVVQGDYPRLNRNHRGEGLAGAHPEFAAYIDAMIQDRRESASPPDDFVTRLLSTEVDGNRLTMIELRTLLAFLLVSGNETTRHLLSNLVHRITMDPELLPALRADPSLIPNAVEESLRFDPPVVVLMRECIQDTVIEGAEIRAGDPIAFGLASANRDEAVYADPNVFRLDRKQPKAHAAFGGGPHVCPGASLARLEGRILLEVLVDRVDSIRLAPGVDREKVALFWANGIPSLSGRVTPQR